MALNFDGFKSRHDAENFVQELAIQFGRLAGVYDTADAAASVSLYPFGLTPPVVVVQRKGDFADEDEIRQLAEQFNGNFAGT